MNPFYLPLKTTIELNYTEQLKTYIINKFGDQAFAPCEAIILKAN